MIRRLAPLLVVIVAALAISVAPATSAPSGLKHSPKNPAAGERVTVTGKGFKKRAKYKVIVNDKTHKRSYKTSKHGKIRFSFRMPAIPNGQAIFIAVKIGKVTAISEVFIADEPPVGPPTLESCEGSEFPPLEDGTCSDWAFENGIDDPDDH